MNDSLNTDPLRRCWAEIDLSAMRTNVAMLRERTGSDTGIMAVVKADAYGHGLERIAASLVDHVAWFGVANVTEALRVLDAVENTRRDAVRVLILSPITEEEIETALKSNLSCSVSSMEEVTAFGEAAARLETTANLHAAVDTGMGRMGIDPQDWPGLIGHIEGHPHCRLEAACTHFPSADEDADFTRKQIKMFRELVVGLDCDVHLANSAGVIDFSDEIDFATLARPGLAVFGVSPDCSRKIDLRPALALKTKITLVRDVKAGATISYGSTFTAPAAMRIATIAAGYGDGYPRHLSGQGAEVLIHETRCPVLGRVTMDQTVIDISRVPQSKAGDEVALIGSQGSEKIGVEEVAQKAGTIPWEILTGLTNRVNRIYFP